MQRKTLTKEELILYLNSKLQRFEGCEGCKFTGVTLLKEEDENGCNWSTASLFCRIGDSPEEFVKPYINQVVEEAYKSFNIST